MQKGILVFGVCQLTKGALEIFHQNNVMVYGILEDEAKWHHTEMVTVPVLGATDHPDFLALLNESCPVFIAYGNTRKRKSCLEFLATQTQEVPISAIHPSVGIAREVQLGQGNYLDTRVCLAPEVSIGNYCILHSGVVIEAETKIHDWVQIGSGSVLGTGVTIEEEVFIGPGVTVVSGVTIQKGASIGAGSVVLGNVKAGDILLGNPAKSIKKT